MGVIEDLSPEERYLFALLNDPSGIDLAEFSWSDPATESGCWRAWNFQWDWWHCRDKLQIDQCLAGGTLILTKRGQVPIESVRVGDEVLTHRNRWRKVTWFWDRGEQETVVVKGHGHPGLTVTPDHEFFLDGGWKVPAVGDRWASPAAFPEMEVPSLPERAYAPGRPCNVPGDVDSPEFLWLYGLYLAEGSVSSSFGKGGTINRTTFSIHASEMPEVESRLTAVGLRFNSFRVAREECFNIVVNSRPLATWMNEHGGKGAKNKSLASWALGLGEQRRSAILAGAMFGDGYEVRGEYSTVSISLAVGIKLLGQSLGFSATMRSSVGKDSQIDGRVIKGGLRFIVGLCENGRASNDGDHYWADVKSIAPGRRARCWDLEVEDDHSFVADGLVVSNCGRSVGKSTSIKVRAFSFPFQYPKQEMVITAPELVHLNPIVGLVEAQAMETRLMRSMLPKGKNHGITHRPFQMDFLNGSRIIGRIPQRDGKGMKGIHPLILELDEGQDFPEPGYIETIETMKSGSEGAAWRIHGVTRGVRDFFFKFTQPGSGWTVHRFPGMIRPDWTDQERQEKIEMYGSRDHPDYRRNVLGKHGDATSPLFVMSRLMACVDQDQGSAYNTEEYLYFRLRAEQLEESGGSITDFLDFPRTHLKKGRKFWAGMDVGFTDHPSEILIFAQELPDKDKPSILRLVTRIHLERIGVSAQAEAIAAVVDFYGVEAFGMDKTGNGLPLFQLVQENFPSSADKIKGYNFSENILVDFDETISFDEDLDDEIKKRGIKRRVLEYASDKCRELVDENRLRIPWDKDLIGEFQGQTYVVTKSTMDQYGRKSYNKGSFHALDAVRMAVLAFVQNPIEELTKEKPDPPSLDLFFGA